MSRSTDIHQLALGDDGWPTSVATENHLASSFADRCDYAFMNKNEMAEADNRSGARGRCAQGRTKVCVHRAKRVSKLHDQRYTRWFERGVDSYELEAHNPTMP